MTRPVAELAKDLSIAGTSKSSSGRHDEDLAFSKATGQLGEDAKVCADRADFLAMATALKAGIPEAAFIVLAVG